MEKTYYTISNKSNSAEIRIYGYIYAYSNEGSSKRLSTELRKLAETHSKITIRVNSGGGDVAEAVAIFNIAESTDAEIHWIVEGIAASAMSFIIMGKNAKISMGKATRLMTHKLSGGAYGSAKTMRDRADMMDKWEEDIYELYAAKTGMTVKEVKAKFFQEGKDVWISPKEALKLGLIDEIIDGTIKKAPAKKDKDVNNLYNHYQSQIDNYYKPKDNKMNKDEKAVIGLPENATDEQVLAKLKELNSRPKAQATPPTQPVPTPSNSSDDEAKKELATLKAERNKTVLDNAQAEGKFLGEDRAKFENLLEKDFLGTKAILDTMPPAQKLPGFNGGKQEDNIDRSKWTVKDWLEKDEPGLAKMEADQPEDYKALIKKEYGDNY